MEENIHNNVKKWLTKHKLFNTFTANLSLPVPKAFFWRFLISAGAFLRSILVSTLEALGMFLGASYYLLLYIEDTITLQVNSELQAREEFA